MKKVFAILISLLFVVSVFGVAQTMAVSLIPSYCNDEYYKISTNAPKVGQTFTISLIKDAMSGVKIEGKTVDEITLGIVANGALPYRIGNVELINVEYYDVDGKLIYSGLVLPDCGYGFPCWSQLVAEDPDVSWAKVEWITWTFRGVSPGTLTTTSGPCDDTVKITILPKDLPFKFFAKLFGFGQKD